MQTLRCKIILTSQGNNFKFKAQKNELKFDVELNKLNEGNNIYFVKFKRTEGNANIFREVVKKFLGAMNL